MYIYHANTFASRTALQPTASFIQVYKSASQGGSAAPGCTQRGYRDGKAALFGSVCAVTVIVISMC